MTYIKFKHNGEEHLAFKHEEDYGIIVDDTIVWDFEWNENITHPQNDLFESLFNTK